jgi:transketolase
VQDLACLRSLPGLLMATPGDPVETAAVVRFLTQAHRASYLRLGKGGEPTIHAGEPLRLASLGPQVVRDGSNSAILACGNILALAAQAAEQSGATLLSCPLWDDALGTRQAIIKTIRSYERIVVVEEHLAAGGFGSFVRECLEDFPGLQGRVRCRALDSDVCGQIASADDLRGKGGLTVEALCRAMD